MSTEAPAAPKVAWIDTLTPEARAEHIAKIKAGREAAAAKRAAKAAKAEARGTQVKAIDVAPPQLAVATETKPVTTAAPVPDAKDARIAELEAKLAAAAAPEFPDLSTLPTHDCTFEFTPRRSKDKVKIDSYESPIWDAITRGEYGPMVANGTLIIRRLVRARSGEILDDKCSVETALTVDHPIARSKMKSFVTTGDHTRMA